MDGTAAPRPSAGWTSGSWAPLADRVFRILWLVQFGSNIGSWMQTVGAQWLLVDGGAAYVAAVQVAYSLPVLLLALPAGALADLVNRRVLLIRVQIVMAATAFLLAVLAWTGHLPPSALLSLTFALGCGLALSTPAWQALQPSLVPRDQIARASALGAVNMNTARALGPALGGFLVSWAGAGWTFASNGVSFLATAIALAAWHQPTVRKPVEEREHIRGALAAGSRYVRNAPRVRRLMLRASLFVPGAVALWALLPVFAKARLGFDAPGYGALLGAVGVGAVAGSFLLRPLTSRLGGERTLTASSLGYAAVIAILALTRSPWIAAVALVGAGIAWIGALTTLNASLQLTLPAWVRARGLAFYLLVFQGGQAAGSLLWGVVAQRAGVQTALAAAAASLVLAALAHVRWPLHDAATADPSPTHAWPEPAVLAEGPAADSTTLVIIEYRVRPGNAAAFLAEMGHVGRSRLRTGAFRWGIYADTASPDRLIETFLVRSWSEHMAQHHERQTGLDNAVEARARNLLAEPPQVVHAVAHRSA
ncbi:MFS transporter [Actinacidiphila glaucinigra]|uniref:MFS transporter n=1 Tax=Actinacidiphila glaucinigra TaxID=235986 RepID=UPI00371D1BEC